ncbi:hypothetical protein GCM10023149_31600 [Mucilaginibacter gynuensis]|uniref:Cytochrome c domain-containing protein n=1 Tax=Mucilaginibacter gynuensis TaxID=1302236 RepID=A0ABP8GPC2_9SPHI
MIKKNTILGAGVAAAVCFTLYSCDKLTGKPIGLAFNDIKGVSFTAVSNVLASINPWGEQPEKSKQTEKLTAEQRYLKHINGDIQHAFATANNGTNAAADTSKPEENRFVKTTLTQGGFYEPTELAVLPNLDVLITQRRGELMLYNNTTKTLTQVGTLNVYHKANVPDVNSEEGLLGITADPNFATNHYIYMYYSPAGDKPIDRLSRFEFKNGALDNASEKVILEVGTQRDICCHTGGSIAFGKDNLLFVSAGDNSTPFDEPNQKYPSHSFGPMDDRPGHQQYDARRSAGNTNDLRGKILRIKINADGTYSIPEGNLFPQGTPKTRPEIYVMGNRNPYRISVDKKTGFLYWGEVGPDANVDSIGTRGPRGYDEVNQARKAGNFGWPFFVGNNYAYNIHNYDTNENAAPADPAKPLNNSRNNTGLVDLPPAQAAYIWYPYAESPDFPEVGSGGRTAMTGPVYHTADFPVKTRYPEYYNNKFFIYEFIRGWIKAVTQKPNGDFVKMEPFIPKTKFNSMIDLEVGPDGRFYILEYGSGWFNKNPDAGLVRIDYLAGNRPPVISDIQVDKASANLPFLLHAKVKATDPEKDKLTYVWNIGGVKKTTLVPELRYPITSAGEKELSVEVFDKAKASAESNTISVVAGNEQPQVNISILGNQTFYFPNSPFTYQVKVTDKGQPVDLTNLYVAGSFIKGQDMAGANLGHQQVSEAMMGKNLMLSLDCKACHKVDETSIGPAFTKVAEKYKDNGDADNYLSKKIIAGGSGVWGEVSMPAHPSLKEADAKQIVHWIRSLSNEANKQKSMPAKGTVTPTDGDIKEQKTVYSLNATYTDAGSAGVKPLSGSKTLILRNSNIEAGEAKNLTGVTAKDSAGTKYLVLPVTTGNFKLGTFDLTGIKAVELNAITATEATTYVVELHADKPTGLIAGSATLNFKAGQQAAAFSIPVKLLPGAKTRGYFVVLKQTTKAQATPAIKSFKFTSL